MIDGLTLFIMTLLAAWTLVDALAILRINQSCNLVIRKSFFGVLFAATGFSFIAIQKVFPPEFSIVPGNLMLFVYVLRELPIIAPTALVEFTGRDICHWLNRFRGRMSSAKLQLASAWCVLVNVGSGNLARHFIFKIMKNNRTTDIYCCWHRLHSLRCRFVNSDLAAY